jgi:hypothetical protein
MKINFDDLDTQPTSPPTPWAFDEVLINRLKLGFFGLAIAATFGVGLSQAFSPQARAIRSEVREQDREQNRQITLQQQQQRHSRTAGQIAEERYQSGCILVRILADDGQPISLFQGLVVVDSRTYKPLPQGTVVCDGNGSTSALESGGRVNTIATTQNLQIINDAIQQGKVR